MSTSECLHEFTGSVIKEETLRSLVKKGLPKTAIYEIEDSYPGYYGLEDQGLRPNFIYIPTKISYSYEDIKRLEKQIKLYCHETFDLSLASIDLMNDIQPCIRIKYLQNYDHLIDIQMFMKEEDVNFLKSGKKIHRKVLIKTNKVFLVKEMEDGIYLDLEESENGYFELPKRLKWKEFEAIALQVKNNWNGIGFDAALAHFNRHDKIVDLVRIYTKENNLDLLTRIKNSFDHYMI